MDFIFTLSIKRLLYLVLVTASACLLWQWFCHSESYWLVWAALLLCLVTQGDSFRQRVINISVTGIIAAFAAFIAGWAGQLPIVPGLYILLVTAVCVFVSHKKTDYFLQAFIINLFVVLGSAIPAVLPDNAARFFFICAGMMVSLIYQIIFYPYFVRNEIKSYVLITLRSLRHLNGIIFSCFLDAEYSDNIYLYERRMHNAKNRFMQSISRLREMIKLVENQSSTMAAGQYRVILQKLDFIYGNMLDYSQLRRRVPDFTTFSLCSQEMNEVRQEIDNAIVSTAAHFTNKKYYPGRDSLSRSISRFEGNYSNVLQVASRDPLPFLFFMDSLQVLAQSLESLGAMTWPEAEHYS